MAASSTSNVARYIDLPVGGSATVWHNVGGSFSVTGEQYRGDCSGVSSGDPGEFCHVGRATVSASVDFASGASTGRAVLASQVLPAFQVVTK
jgi:hypothetical protein